jgi:hypothetical protein
MEVGCGGEQAILTGIRKIPNSPGQKVATYKCCKCGQSFRLGTA